MDNLNPPKYMTEIHKRKYYALFCPLGLVVISFIIQNKYQIEEVKYLALSGLVWYLLVYVIYKVNKPIPPDTTAGNVFSPISGKITKIETNRIYITKHFWHSVDIRNASSEPEIGIRFSSGHPVLLEGFSSEAGKLIGFKTGKISCELIIPPNYKILSATDDNVTAGYSVLASKDNEDE